MAQKRSNVPIIAAVAAAGAGYYLYSAGGNPKVAEKKFEHDAASLSSSVKSHLPGKEKEVKTEAKVLGQEAGAKIDSAISSAKAKAAELENNLNKYASDAEKKFESARAQTGKDVTSAIDKFDRSVEKGAAQVSNSVSNGAEQAKGGMGSWFGFGGK